MRQIEVREPRARRVTLFVACSLVIAIAVGGNGASSCRSTAAGDEASGAPVEQAADSLGPMMQAYYQAHPDLIDGPLRPAPATTDKIEADIRAGLDTGEDIWLPGYLPDGFVLAAPYNGDGSGSAYPNPYTFGRGYGVTYTDGCGYIMVIKNSDDDLSRGEWILLEESVAGRQLRLQQSADVTVVATVDDGKDSLLVAGAGFAGEQLAEELTRVAAGLILR